MCWYWINEDDWAKGQIWRPHFQASVDSWTPLIGYSPISIQFSQLSFFFLSFLSTSQSKLTILCNIGWSIWWSPGGQFWYLQAPMGLCSSSDEWWQRSNLTIKNVPEVHKLVEDYLITGENLNTLEERRREILEKCRKQNLTIFIWKFVIRKRIKFAGFHLSKEGIEPDTSKTSAIANFPTSPIILKVQSLLYPYSQV